jgi:hypothetical protein
MARLDDGFPTLIELAGVPGVVGLRLLEKEVTPPGIDMGGTVDTTTMRNSFWRTRNPKHLATLTALTGVMAYDPFIFSDFTIFGVNIQATVGFSDGSSVIFWGTFDKFTPNPHREGEQPTANITFEPTNQDNAGNEIFPLYVP